MLEFTSSLYLGLHHASHELRPWSRLTTGVPAALSAPPGARIVAARVAQLQGCEVAALGRSTLHLFWDLFGIVAAGRWEVYVDAATYPIAGWGAVRAATHGTPVKYVPHHDPAAVAREMGRGQHHRPPIIVADGLCAGCGGTAPVAAYLRVVEPHDGLVVLDDTQAVGITGRAPGPAAPYGWGGGGTIPRTSTEGRRVIVVSSLAKAFGAPIAALVGPAGMVGRLEAEGETRVHSSPPSAADLGAAEHALDENEERGDALRRRLVGLVLRLKDRLAQYGLGTRGLHPFQTLMPAPTLDPVRVHRDLMGRGIGAILHRPRCAGGARLSLLITARHRPEEIDAVVYAIADARCDESAGRVAGGASR